MEDTAVMGRQHAVRLTTVRVLHRDAEGAILRLEHAFTTLLPFPLVTGRGEEFLEALEAARRRVA